MILTLNFQHPLTTHFWRERRPLVLACGCFDILTVGHVRHLQAAKRLGKCLCVLVTADRHVNKPGRPIVPEDQRAEVVDALGCVDFTIINSHPTAVEAVRCLRPQVYIKGRDYYFGKATKSLAEEAKTVKSVGGRLEFTVTDEVHTSDIVERIEEAYNHLLVESE